MQIGVFAAPGRTQWRFVALARVTAGEMTAMRAERLRRRIGIVRMRFGSRLLCGGERFQPLWTTTNGNCFRRVCDKALKHR
jgi:hypothetical protein